MPEHKVTRKYEEYDVPGNKIYVIQCRCGWREKSYNNDTLVVAYQKHVVDERNKGN